MQLMKSKPTLKDVDGRVPGRVQLVSIRLDEDDPKQMCTFFEEESGKRDPYLRAEGLMRSLEDDWPEHEWAMIGNWRARYLLWAWNMENMGLDFGEDALSPQAYLDTFE
jgi:hypothetical protein